MNKALFAYPWILLLALAALAPSPALAQAPARTLSLEETVRLAKERSPEALAARHRFRGSYWSYQAYRATYMPKLNLNATIPSLQRAITKYTTSGGEEVFLERSFISSSLDLALSKTVGPTGGTFFLGSGLERIDNLSDSVRTSWLSTPMSVGYSQPLFQYNAWKWQNKLEPMRYEEARRTWVEDMEQVSLTGINRFFDVLISRQRLSIAQTNEANYDTLYKIAIGRYNLGKIAENELLQLELSLLQSQGEVEDARLELEMNLFRLRSFLRMPEDAPLELAEPLPPALDVVEVDRALTFARQNHPEVIRLERSMMESESALNKARMDGRLNASLYAIYGLVQSAEDLAGVYADPQEQQQLTLGIQLPILDWGLARSRIRMAESEVELTRTQVDQQRVDFDQQVFLKVMQYNMQQRQFMIAQKSDTVAKKRYAVTKQRYLLGRITITDLNIAQVESDNARQAYMSALHQYWKSYYELRQLTLYDFLRDTPIGLDAEGLLRD
ncbi:MAG TPA: TolC family protein [Bacteroidales bacterium]|nr:TolC family protein [Bacteroidales bacterium]HRZ76268.1 TolC family protein [Bacteroidales bacterium]